MYKLRFKQDDYFPHQWDFLTSDKMINGLCGGLGSGKTHVFIRKTLLNLFKRKNNKGVSNGWIIYPTYDLAEELFVAPFTELLARAPKLKTPDPFVCNNCPAVPSAVGCDKPSKIILPDRLKKDY